MEKNAKQRERERGRKKEKNWTNQTDARANNAVNTSHFQRETMNYHLPNHHKWVHSNSLLAILIGKHHVSRNSSKLAANLVPFNRVFEYALLSTRLSRNQWSCTTHRRNEISLTHQTHLIAFGHILRGYLLHRISLCCVISSEMQFFFRKSHLPPHWITLFTKNIQFLLFNWSTNWPGLKFTFPLRSNSILIHIIFNS